MLSGEGAYTSRSNNLENYDSLGKSAGIAFY